jgi:hypothetical protein
MAVTGALAVLRGCCGVDLAGCLRQQSRDVNGDGLGDLINLAPNRPSSANRAWHSSFSVAAPLRRSSVSSLLPENGGDGSRGFALKAITLLDRVGMAVGAAVTSW